MTGEPVELPYEGLGKQVIPILSVMTLTGRTGKSDEAILHDTLALALAYLKGEEPLKTAAVLLPSKRLGPAYIKDEEQCENPQGLAGYPVLIQFFKDAPNPKLNWPMEYHLGTYAGLKYYAHRYLEKSGLTELAELYRMVYEDWKTAFDIKTTQDIMDDSTREAIAAALSRAQANEQKALGIMEGLVGNLEQA